MSDEKPMGQVIQTRIETISARWFVERRIPPTANNPSLGPS